MRDTSFKDSFQRMHAYRLQLNREHILATGWEEKHLIDIEAAEGDICQYFWRQACRVCLTLPVHDNFYLSWLFRGSRGFLPNTNPALAPPFLKRDNFVKLKVYIYKAYIIATLCITVGICESC